MGVISELELRTVLAQVGINMIAAVGSTLILQFGDVLSSDPQYTITQLATSSIILFSTITIATVISSFEREDAKYLFVISILIAFTALYQWTYSFPDLATEPWSIFAAQLPILGLMAATSFLACKWG